MSNADGEDKKKMRTSKSRSKSVAKRVGDDKGAGFKSVDDRMLAAKLADKAQRKRNKQAKAGEGDRSIGNTLPKWLNYGKRGNGKTDRR